MHVWAQAAADLVLGAFCPGCGAPQVPLCSQCRHAIAPIPRQVGEAGALPVWAAGEHDGVLRRALVAWKERGRHGLTRVLARHLASSVIASGEEVVRLVPVPTSRRSRRVRGADLSRSLAEAATLHLRSVGIDARVEPLLKIVRVTANQSSLAAWQRRSNLEGAFGASRGYDGPVPLVVVDDIWTTGSTALEAVRAVEAGGMRVSAVAVVANTPQRHH